MKKSIILLLLAWLCYHAPAQVSVNTDGAPPVSSAMLEVKSTDRGFLPPRMTTAQRDAISSPVAGLTIYNTSKNCNETYNGTTWVGNTHYIGESYGGGIVFYIYDSGQHGLIAATADQATIVQWFNGVYKITGTTGDGLNAGAMNTAMIIAFQMNDNQSGIFAAKVCADYSVTVDGITFGDWYLPSKYELNLLYVKQTIVGGFADYAYWSSTENNNNTAWSIWFSGSRQDYYGWTYKHHYLNVRAIRAF